jgi:hypothetical protein
MKNLDNIEKFLLDNREQFDTETPRTHLWASIAERLEGTDNIEHFITSNRADFDLETPSLKIWANIEKKIIGKDNLDFFIEKNRPEFDSETPSEQVWTGVERYLQGENVEQFVRENRYDFDSEIPNLKVWANIEKALPTRKEGAKTLTFNWLRRAAAAVALLIMGVGIGLFINNKSSNDAMVGTVPEFKEAEEFYNQKMASQMTKLVGYNPDPSVLSDLKKVDEVRNELKKELELTPDTNREEIIRRLIQNYQTKLGILERVLNNIEEHQIESQKKQQQNGKI